MATPSAKHITFYPVPTDEAVSGSAIDFIDLTQPTYEPIKNQKFEWQVPLTVMDSHHLAKRPKMDIAVAVAASNDAPKPSTSNPIDDQHLLANTATTIASAMSAQLPEAKLASAPLKHAATNNPVSFKTVENPGAAQDLSAIPAQDLAAEGLLDIGETSEFIESGSTESGVLSGEQQPITLPNYEAIPETLSPEIAASLVTNSPVFDTDNDNNGNSNSSNNVNADADADDDDSDIDSDTDTDNLDPEALALIEEEKRQEKEAKLEAYKQFVAEQESQVEIDYQGIRVSIEANALPSRMYFTMNALSAIIASYGLVVNSAAVVIGAMLVAMMLGPISGVALATIDYRMPFLRKSLLTVLAGGTMVVLVGFIVGWLHEDMPLSSEILSRTQPTSMDLMIALAGGMAGAYAMISPNLSVAVVGVAVATALVPPLAASGILFAHGEARLGFGALLLAITNIIAIQFTNALVLWFAGFRRLMVEDYKTHPFIAFCRRNAVPLILLAGIGSYLSYNLNIISKKQNFENEVKETINSYFIDKGNALTATQFVKKEDYQMIRAVIRGETRPSSVDAKHLENIISKRKIEKYSDDVPVRVQLRYMPVVVIDSSPDFNGSLDKTDAAILNTENAN